MWPGPPHTTLVRVIPLLQLADLKRIEEASEARRLKEEKEKWRADPASSRFAKASSPPSSVCPRLRQALKKRNGGLKAVNLMAGERSKTIKEMGRTMQVVQA